MSSETRKQLIDYFAAVSEQELNEHLEALELNQEGTYYEKLARLEKWMLGKYDETDFVDVEELSTDEKRIKREVVRDTFIDTIIAKSISLTDSSIDIMAPHPFQYVKQDPLIKQNLDKTRPIVNIDSQNDEQMENTQTSQTNDQEQNQGTLPSGTNNTKSANDGDTPLGQHQTTETHSQNQRTPQLPLLEVITLPSGGKVLVPSEFMLLHRQLLADLEIMKVQNRIIQANFAAVQQIQRANDDEKRAMQRQIDILRSQVNETELINHRHQYVPPSSTRVDFNLKNNLCDTIEHSVSQQNAVGNTFTINNGSCSSPKTNIGQDARTDRITSAKSPQVVQTEVTQNNPGTKLNMSNTPKAKESIGKII